MKSSIFRISLAALLLLVLGCSKLDWKEIFHHHKKDKVQINRPVKAPVAISFLDANRLLSTQIPNVKITLTDTSGQVVTPNNLSFSSLNIAGGVVSLALKESAIFSRDNPYRFTIKAEASGYISNSRSILIYNDTAQYVVVFMTKIDDPPVGMAGFTGNIPITNSTVMSDITLTPNATNKVKRKIIVNIPEGTVLMSNGKRLNSSIQNVSYNFVYGSPSSVDALRTFPGGAGGTLVTDALVYDIDTGSPINEATPRNPIYFISTGWMTLEMNAGNDKVTDFSKPFSMNMPIEASSINPDTQKPFQVGDFIPSWSLNDQGAWIRENQSSVRTSQDGLIATMSIYHLSAWNLDYGTNLCPTTKVIPYTIASTERLYCDIVGSLNGIPFLLATGTNQNVEFLSGSGRHHDILNVPLLADLTFLAYNASTFGLVRAASRFTCATAPPTMSIPPPVGTPQSINLNFEYTVDTDGDGLVDDSRPICNNAVFFSPGDGCSLGVAWEYGGMLQVAPGTKVGTTTLYKEGPFESTCIRLFYGRSTTNALTEPLLINFTMNMLLNDGLPHPASSSTIPDIMYTYFRDTNTFTVSIPGGSLGAISSCAL